MKNIKTHGTYLRRPTKITVLNQEFKVEWVSTGDVHGSVDLNKCIIQMVKGYPKGTTADTFLHELIHAVNHVMGIDDSTNEEESTTRLSTGLCTVWKHNPKVFEWLHKQFIT
jgi:hypothetical protein